jgi:ParB family transcriptional regulator, chromosome partitioning protein
MVKTRLNIQLAGASDISVFDENEQERVMANSVQKVQDIKLEQIQPNKNQPRQDLETNIENLKESIEQEGLLQPIILSKIAHDKYIIVAGHRRFKAHQLLNRDTIKAIINPGTFTDEQLDKKALLENLQRENLSNVEIAETLYKLNKDKSFNVAKISKVTGYKRSQIFDYLRCQKAIINNQITKDQLARLGITKSIKKLQDLYSPVTGLREKNRHSELKEAKKKSKLSFKIVIKDIKNKKEIKKAIKASENQLLELKKMLKELQK